MDAIDPAEHLSAIIGLPGKERESVNVRIALSQYPDLKAFKLHTGEVLLSDPEMGPYCDDVLIQRYGKEWIAMPFTEDGGIRLHTHPTVFFIGLENDLGFGIIPYANWESYLEEISVDFLVIRKIRNFLSSHAPAYY